MKFLRIIILIALVISFMPLDAFCDDHQSMGHCHGVVSCHSCSNGAVLASAASLNSPDIATYLTTPSDNNHETPVVPTEERPPLSLLS